MAKTILAAIIIIGLISQIVIATPLSNIQQQAPSVTITQDGLKFIATILLICQDPNEGYWLQCRTGETIVMVWESDVAGLEVGRRYEILCTYHGHMPYQFGNVSVYIGIIWRAIE